MHQIKETLISDDLLQEYFVCDLNSCKGACCVEGDSGAPLLEEEKQILEDIYPLVEGYLTDEGKAEIQNQGKFVVDKDVLFVIGLTPISLKEIFWENEFLSNNEISKVISSNKSIFKYNNEFIFVDNKEMYFKYSCKRNFCGNEKYTIIIECASRFF